MHSQVIEQEPLNEAKVTTVQESKDKDGTSKKKKKRRRKCQKGQSLQKAKSTVGPDSKSDQAKANNEVLNTSLRPQPQSNPSKAKQSAGVPKIFSETTPDSEARLSSTQSIKTEDKINLQRSTRRTRTEEENTLRASQAAIIKAILGADSSLDTLQAPLAQHTPRDASSSELWDTSKRQINPSLQLEQVHPTSSTSKKRYSTSKAMAFESVIHGKQASHSDKLPPVTSSEFIKRASTYVGTIGDKYRRPIGSKSSTNGNNWKMTPTSGMSSNTALPNTSDQLMHHKGNDRHRYADEPKPMVMASEPKPTVVASEPRNQQKPAEPSKMYESWPKAEIGSGPPQRNLKPKKSTEMVKTQIEAESKQSDREAQRKIELEDKLPTLADQLVALLPEAYRHIPKPTFLKERREIEAREKAAKVQEIKPRRQEDFGKTPLKHDKGNKQQHSTNLKHVQHVKPQNENLENHAAQIKASRQLNPSHHQDSAKPSESKHEQNDTLQVAGGATAVDKNEGTVPNKRPIIPAAQSAGQKNDDGGITLWRAHATPEQKAKIRKVIERAFELSKGNPARTDHGGHTSNVFESNESSMSRDLLDLPKISYPADDSRFRKDATEWKRFVSHEKPDPAQHPSIRDAENQLRCQYVGWDGNLTPPSTDWTIPAEFDFRNVAQLRLMEKWLEDNVENALYRPFEVDLTTEGFRDGSLPASGVHRPYALYPPDSLFVGGKPDFGSVDWSLVPTDPPRMPGTFLIPENVNEVIRIATVHRIKTKQEYIAEKEELRRQKKERALSDFKLDPNRAQLVNNPWIPKANIYIRPAKRSDIPQITELFNYYVEHTIHAIECRRIDEQEMDGRLKMAEREKKAFLVAILRNPKGAKHLSPGVQRRRHGRDPHRQSTAQAAESEVVVGFSLLEKFSLWGSTMHNTAELYLYVSPNHLHMGVATNLMDRMIPSVDSCHPSHRGTDFVPPDRQAQLLYEIGGAANVKKLVVSLFYRTGEEDEFRWKKQWLEGKFIFDQASYMHNIAEKFGEPHHMAQFVRETSNAGGITSTHYPQHDIAVHNIISHI